MKGWQCPNCGYCYAPVMTYCENCNRPKHEKTITTTTIQLTKLCNCGVKLPLGTVSDYCSICNGRILK